ncbi:ATP-binding protein [Methanospirillum stamsii]|uniref:histidine kinase n=1 Tax=Methanospirillum stamsii TaxID=1277351 RepID=A0A2V2N377_9EURY|nr:ATP-binding protein [Methanospirillum stamsii]PWR74602.1 hypothetical protein DLD82_08450 [Methanospirillum stamsii]
MKEWNLLNTRLSFPVLVMVMLTTIFIFFIGAISLLSYEQTKNHLLDEWDNEIRYNEHHLIHNLQLVNQGLLLFDHSFDDSMKEQFVPFLEAYNQSGQDPSRINLTVMKENLNPSLRKITDFYIINETGVVIDTTYISDKGLDFKIWPAVYEDISKIRIGDSFQADRAVYGFAAIGRTRKFAYHPTPDNKYLLEISYLISGHSEGRHNFSYANVMREFVNNTPHIQSLTLYDSMYRSIWTNQLNGKVTDKDIIKQVKNSYLGKNRTAIEDPVNNSELYYFFIEISDNKTVSGNMLDLVGRLEYDTSSRQDHIESILLYHSLIAGIGAILGFFIAYILAYHLTRPLRRIIDDLNRIAHGDLNHRVSYSGSPEFSQLENSINLLISYVNDLISSLQDQEKHLRESKEKYQNLVEQLNEGIWIIDENEKTTFVNSRMASMLEYDPEELLDTSISDLTHPSCTITMEKKLQNRHNGIAERYEVVLVTKNKHLLYAEISASPIFDENGLFAGSSGVVTDITHRKENEQKIREYMIKLEERTHELEVVRDQLFRINEDLDRIVHDRTEEVIRLLEQKNDFIMQLGHDLRTPLTPIIGLIPEVSHSSVEEQKLILNIIERNARHIQTIANKSLKLAKLNSVDYIPDSEPVNVADAVRSVYDIHRTSLRYKEITATTDISPDIIIHADPVLFHELIDNLVSNAIKFSKPAGGTIHIAGQIQAGSLILTVADNGIGISSDEKLKIFEEFYKSDTSRHDKTSTGLGLPICRKIVEKHNGQISVYSDGVGLGCVFTITLPAGPPFDVFPE